MSKCLTFVCAVLSFCSDFFSYIYAIIILLYQWLSGSDLKIGKREVPSSVSGFACSLLLAIRNFQSFSPKWARIPQKDPPRRAFSLADQGPTRGLWVLVLQCSNATHNNFLQLNKGKK